MTLALQRASEIAAKLRSLDVELCHWKKLTDDEKHGLRRNHTQVRRLVASVDGMTERIRAEITAAQSEPSMVFDKAEIWERQILAAHSVWETFRAKLLLREDAFFRDVLAACDDFAWACYGPAVKRFDPDRKGPPLVYFTSTWSPFAISRDSNFQNEVRAGPGTRGILGDEAFQKVLRRLPIPLIGVPWYQTFHLPGALIIAHEVGHVVEFDFDLTDEITVAIRGAALANPEVWESWQSEIFADLYACLVSGPTFVGAILNLLATSVDAVRTEQFQGGRYPTRALRVELMLTALAKLGHASAAQRLRATWEDVYGPMGTMLEFLPDLPKIVRAIYFGPYRGAPLTTLPAFPSDASGLVQTIAEAAAWNMPGPSGGDADPRQLFAAAQWAHENLPPAEAFAACGRIMTRVAERGRDQYRMRGEPVADLVTVASELSEQEERDREAGRELADELFTR